LYKNVNERKRRACLKTRLASLRAGGRILDAGAGELQASLFARISASLQVDNGKELSHLFWRRGIGPFLKYAERLETETGLFSIHI
jgi:hypothetical protein